jgi:hypothetical protein
MSPKLAIAAALSVLLMATYVLLGDDSRRVPFAGEHDFAPVVRIPQLGLPAFGPLLPER